MSEENDPANTPSDKPLISENELKALKTELEEAKTERDALKKTEDERLEKELEALRTSVNAYVKDGDTTFTEDEVKEMGSPELRIALKALKTISPSPKVGGNAGANDPFDPAPEVIRGKAYARMTVGDIYEHVPNANVRYSPGVEPLKEGE